MSQKNMRLAVSPNLIKLSYPNSNLYDRHVRLGSGFLIYAKDNLFSCFIVMLRKGDVELDFGNNFLESAQMLIKKSLANNFMGGCHRWTAVEIFKFIRSCTATPRWALVGPLGRTTWSTRACLPSRYWVHTLNTSVSRSWRSSVSSKPQWIPRFLCVQVKESSGYRPIAILEAQLKTTQTHLIQSWHRLPRVEKHLVNALKSRQLRGPQSDFLVTNFI